jgi:hypothetical protein
MLFIDHMSGSLTVNVELVSKIHVFAIFPLKFSVVFVLAFSVEVFGCKSVKPEVPCIVA